MMSEARNIDGKGAATLSSTTLRIKFPYFLYFIGKITTFHIAALVKSLISIYLFIAIS